MVFANKQMDNKSLLLELLPHPFVEGYISPDAPKGTAKSDLMWPGSSRRTGWTWINCSAHCCSCPKCTYLKRDSSLAIMTLTLSGILLRTSPSTTLLLDEWPVSHLLSTSQPSLDVMMPMGMIGSTSRVGAITVLLLLMIKDLRFPSASVTSTGLMSSLFSCGLIGLNAWVVPQSINPLHR